MFTTRLLYALILTCVATGIIGYLTRNIIVWNKAFGIVFALYFILYETVSMYGILNGVTGIVLWVVMVVFLVFLLFFAQKENALWGSFYFLSNVLLVKAFHFVGQFVFLAFYCKFNMDDVFSRLDELSTEMFFAFLFMYLPAMVATDFFWKSLQMLPSKTLRLTAVGMAIVCLAMEHLGAWHKIVLVMPCVLMLLFIVAIYRIEKENEQARLLLYHRELEKQMKQKDAELAKLRKEVEKYYIKAGQVEGDYHAQVLHKIDEAKME